MAAVLPAGADMVEVRDTVTKVDLMGADPTVVCSGVGAGVVVDRKRGTGAIVVAMSAIWLVNVRLAR